jgi:large subunit ribosomal protein L19
MKNRLMAAVEETGLKKDLPPLAVGDTVDVHQRILEGTKERIQIFNGVVIALRGEGMRAMMTVRRIVQGEGVERIFPLNSPKIARIDIKRSGRVRRAKLYYMRNLVGKATRLRERKAKPTADGEKKGAARSEAKAPKPEGEKKA